MKILGLLFLLVVATSAPALAQQKATIPTAQLQALLEPEIKANKVFFEVYNEHGVHIFIKYKGMYEYGKATIGLELKELLSRLAKELKTLPYNSVAEVKIISGIKIRGALTIGGKDEVMLKERADSATAVMVGHDSSPNRYDSDSIFIGVMKFMKADDVEKNVMGELAGQYLSITLTTRDFPNSTPLARPKAPIPAAKLQALLEPEIRAGKVRFENQQEMGVDIFIKFKGMYEPGTAKIGPELKALLTRIAQELKTPPYKSILEVEVTSSINTVSPLSRKDEDLIFDRAENAVAVMVEHDGTPKRYFFDGTTSMGLKFENDDEVEGKLAGQRLSILLAPRRIPR